MPALSLVLGKKQFRTAIGVLELDAAMSVDHSYGANPSKNPIEKGSDITDHIKLENPTIQVEGIVSEAPLSLLGSAFNVLTGALSTRFTDALGAFGSSIGAAALGSIAGLISNRNPNDNQFPIKAFDYLVELRNKRIPFTVVTRLKRYEDMVVTRLSFPQQASNGNSLVFNATFEQIQLVQTQTVIIPETKVKKSGAASKQNTGKQPQKESVATNATIAKGFLNKVF